MLAGWLEHCRDAAWLADREARVVAHEARVAADLARLGSAGVDRGPGSPLRTCAACGRGFRCCDGARPRCYGCHKAGRYAG